MTNLVIDAGNTYTKLAVFKDNKLIDMFRLRSIEIPFLQQLIEKHIVSFSIVSNVAEFPEACKIYLKEHTHFSVLDQHTPLEIINKYISKHTLGPDRLAVAVAANALYPNTNILVIDCGTCITYDFIDSQKNYWGGAISPGLQMRFSALHTFTVNLPLLKFEQQDVPLIGNSTEASINSGVINGTIHEIQASIEAYQQKYETLQIILCGGDSIFFDTHLKSSIFVEPELVLIGLNTIVNQQNESN